MWFVYSWWRRSVIPLYILLRVRKGPQAPELAWLDTYINSNYLGQDWRTFATMSPDEVDEWITRRLRNW